LAGANVIRFAPAYLVSTGELDEAVAILARALEEAP
jgi:acetylornithine/succinyldiaminopimelate/putrescine aminotransferase